MPARTSKTDPQILEMPAQKMAVVEGKGAPDKVFGELMPALYGSVYTLKFALKKQGLETFKVRLEIWDYGTVAQVLHIGAYDQETANIERLLKFIKDNGYQVIGDHEEEYLTRPDAKVMKTIIRYRIKKK